MSHSTEPRLPRLSRRANAVGESITLAIAAEAKRMRAEGINVISFSTGEPDFPTPEPAKRAGIRAIEENFTKYVQAEGIPELRSAVAEKFQRDNNIATDASRVLISAGGKQSLANALLAVVDEGQEVLIPSPYWTSYPDLVRIAGGVPVILDTSADERYKMDPEMLRASIGPATRALILNTPSNPTGVMYTREELEAIGRVLAETGTYVIADELYERIVFDGNEHFSIGSMPELRDLAVTVNGLSKAYAMTGWRVSYMCGPTDVMAACGRIQSQMTSHPCTISMRAAYAALTEVHEEVNEMVAAFERRRDLIVGLAADVPNITYPHPDGAFYLFIDISAYLGGAMPTDVDLARYLLRDHHIAVIPGSAFGDDRAIRLSYACSDADIVEGMARIKRGLGEIES